MQKALREVKECVASGVTPEGLAAKVPEQEKGGGGKGRRKVKGEKEEKGDQGEEGGKGEGGDDQKTGKEDSSEQQVIFFFSFFFAEGLFLLFAALTQEES